MCRRVFALILGILFLIVGVMGFCHPLLYPYTGPHLTAFAKGKGDLLNLFPVNVPHDIVHLAFGLLGVAAFFGGQGAAKHYARFVGIVYLLLAVAGALPWAKLQTAFGFMPISDADVWLHALIGLVASYVGFAMAQAPGAKAAVPDPTA
jgi:Domain of unknown function (DUF4383)